MDTIFALSSGQPPAAIAVVRISGPGALAALETLADKMPQPRQATLVQLSEDGDMLDRALALRFDGPRSATGEDLVELHLHGGRAVVAAVLAALGRIGGMRQAEPGEFTRRAFINGRIDLAEAEGLADLLQAETQSQRRSAMGLAEGTLSRLVQGWTQDLLRLSAAVEAQLDFADEGDIESGLPPQWHVDLGRLVGAIEDLLDRPPAERLRDGVRVVIAGPPNSGKSTLLNALVGREAAITSAIAGTTRDLIEASVAMNGVPLVLVDSAGLRETGDAIEAIGVDRAEAAVTAADLVLWLGVPEDRPERPGVILVSPKSDVGLHPSGRGLPVSALTGDGLGVLVDRLVLEARALLPHDGEVTTNRRHQEALREAVVGLNEAKREKDLILVAEGLRCARVALGRVTGQAGVEHMLDALFGSFCIGK